VEGGAPRTASEGDSPEPETVGSGPDGAFPANPCAYDAGLRCAPTTPASGVCLRPGLRRAPLGRWNLGACFPGAGNAGRLEIRRGPTGRWCGAWIGGAAGGGPGGVRCAPDRGGGRRPAGTGRRSRAATPSSSAPPSRPSRPPNPRTARTRSSLLRGPRSPSCGLRPTVPESYPVLVADPDRVHHEDPPSRAGVVAVSVSLRHQRSSVTTQRPAPASRRSATGRTRSPFPDHRDGCPPG
jgi:hypothetical protein